MDGNINNKLDYNSPVPLYAQIKEKLLEYINEHREEEFDSLEKKAGIKIKPEGELAEIFGVSRMTIRQAMKELVNEGLLYRRKGLGTFVSDEYIKGQLSQIERFVDEWSLQQNKKIDVDVLEYKEVPLPEIWEGLMELPRGTPVLFINRLRYAEDKPIALDYRYMPLEFKEFIEPDDIKNESLFMLLVKKGNIVIETANYEIGAKLPSEEEARLLEIKMNVPLITRELVIYSLRSKPVILGISVYGSDRFKYSVTVPSTTAKRSNNRAGFNSNKKQR